MRLLVLYSELAGYFYSCLETLVADYDVEVTVVMWPVNKQAPFRFKENPKIRIREKSEFADRGQLLEFCRQYDPSILYTSGWMDKDYLAVASVFRKQGKPVIVALDTQWFGTSRQWLATAISPFYFKRIFTNVWVPGLFQYEYARRLSFPRNRISTGMYSGNQPAFHASYLQHRASKQEKYPRNFYYIGRFSPEKGTKELYTVFRSFSAEERNGWRLVFVGTGPLKNEIQPTDSIEVRDFLQPEELPSVVADAGCLVFPSNRDAWGVSVHEFCAAGLPLVVSDAAGAITAFVRERYNGYTFKAGSTDSLRKSLLKLMQTRESDLLTMGDRSASLSFQITPSTWAATLVSIYEQNG